MGIQSHEVNDHRLKPSNWSQEMLGKKGQRDLWGSQGCLKVIDRDLMYFSPLYGTCYNKEYLFQENNYLQP